MLPTPECNSQFRKNREEYCREVAHVTLHGGVYKNRALKTNGMINNKILIETLPQQSPAGDPELVEFMDGAVILPDVPFVPRLQT